MFIRDSQNLLQWKNILFGNICLYIPLLIVAFAKYNENLQLDHPLLDILNKESLVCMVKYVSGCSTGAPRVLPAVIDSNIPAKTISRRIADFRVWAAWSDSIVLSLVF